MSAPVKAKDFADKDGAKACGICGKSFGMTLWRYHCHWCGHVVCDDCSKATVNLQPLHGSSARVCDQCKERAVAYAANRGPNGGRRLGGEATAKGTAEEEREKRVAMLEARMQRQPSATLSRQNTTGSIRAEQKASSSSDVLVRSQTTADVAEEPTAGTAPKEAPNDGTLEPQRSQETNPMLEAALRRQAAAKPGTGAADQEKAVLLGKIAGRLKAINKEEPFGLRSMDAGKLRIYLRHLESES